MTVATPLTAAAPSGSRQRFCTSFGFWIHMSVLMWFKFWFGFSFESYLNSGSVNAVDGSGSVQDASRVRL
ncbi:hypothetical protein HanXRQr2_Chr17g0819301 [Helianthus annuus]|uniref:Uncharacterized protein n=1 Tax=Helianthus annuus TaxID=4232 RepID=A0A9K3GWF4_HELAN|nr:hypothetical protein HanXRQr2_Chr17g0819301 [Helianthus annuus]KAJ0814658.1 hypothetical protein HanPSC8_Chr17g0788381 [Helianthus annuus]